MMSSKLLTLFLAFAAFSVAYGTRSPYPPISRACRRAYRRCEFRFIGPDYLRFFSVRGPADVAFTPRIISRRPHELLGVLNSNNIIPEVINADGSVTPITLLPAKQPFTPTHFKPYTINKTPFSGVGHQTFHQNQKDVIRFKCLRVWFTEYQVLEKAYPLVVKENKNNVPKYLNKCVVFFTF